MNGSTASASGEPFVRSGQRDLVVSVNWIGDAIMAMPGLQLYRRAHPDRHITVLARGVIADLWKLSRAPDEVIRYDGRPGISDPLYTDLRARGFTRAWVLPNSFRSAWLAFRSAAPERIGVPGRGRRWLLTRCPPRWSDPARLHQAWEYLQLFQPDGSPGAIPPPELHVPHTDREAAIRKHGPFRIPLVGMIPGAARGPSKRWPERHFIDLARRFVGEGWSVALFGGHDDHALCDRISVAVDGVPVNLAGRTTLSEWAALLGECRTVVANDSGGMHLAAALGRPVVALYGITDPDRTGPIGPRCRILQKSDRRSRDVPRESAEAEASLAAILPGEVYEAAMELLHAGDKGGA